MTTTRAPASDSAEMVGSEARIRPSSVIRSPSSGTFRSERTSTRPTGDALVEQVVESLHASPQSFEATSAVMSTRRLE